MDNYDLARKVLTHCNKTGDKKISVKKNKIIVSSGTFVLIDGIIIFKKRRKTNFINY